MDEEAKNERPIEDLLKLPYSELTDEEIDRVVEAKAQMAALDSAFEQVQADYQAAMALNVATWRQTAQAANDHLQGLKADAQEAYRTALQLAGVTGEEADSEQEPA